MSTVTQLMTDCDEQVCQMCHCVGEGCDGTVCHGFDVD